MDYLVKKPKQSAKLSGLSVTGALFPRPPSVVVVSMALQDKGDEIIWPSELCSDES